MPRGPDSIVRESETRPPAGKLTHIRRSLYELVQLMPHLEIIDDCYAHGLVDGEPSEYYG